MEPPDISMYQCINKKWECTNVLRNNKPFCSTSGTRCVAVMYDG